MAYRLAQHSEADGAVIPLHLGLAAPLGLRGQCSLRGFLHRRFRFKKQRNRTKTENSSSLSSARFLLIFSLSPTLCVCVKTGLEW